MIYLRSVSQVSIAFSLLLVPALAAPPADETYKTLRAAAVVDSIPVENIVLKRDAGVLTLKSGTLGFTAPVSGRYTVAVFSGEGEFTFTPAAAVHKMYLSSIAGPESVKEAFDRALFCFTDQTGKELRSQGTPRADQALTSLLNDFREKLRARREDPRSMWESMTSTESMDNIEMNILADLYNPAQPGFFSAYLHGRKHSDMRFLVNPRGVLNDLPASEEVAVIVIDQESDDGAWYLGHLQAETGATAEDKRVVESLGYKIETTIAKNDHVSAAAEIRFRPVLSGDRVIKFGLLPNLRVSKVTEGTLEIPFVQEDREKDGSLHVIMPAAMDRGAEHTLKIEYQGDKVLRKTGNGNYSVGARTSWYPSLNSFQDHSAYDLTFRIPKKYKLVSVGKLKREWTEKDDACSQWVSDVPLAVAGFNFGSFEKKSSKDPNSGFEIEAYATTEPPDYLREAESEMTGMISPKRFMDQKIAEALTAVRLYEAFFGKSPFGRMALSQQSAFNYGQSWPTLIYLPLSAYLDSTQRWAVTGSVGGGLSHFVDEVTAHEVAHQWFGHMVSPRTYHDEWISEGFATFAAGLYLQFTEKTNSKYLDYWKRAKERLLEKNQYGRRANDAGPIWLGRQLDSFRNDNAYDTVVYQKGGYIVNMLRMLMYDRQQGDKRFQTMMQEFIQQNLNRPVTTADFQRVVEKYMPPVMNATGDGKLDWFFAQWVYGTAIPKYKLDYQLVQQGNTWVAQGTLSQSEVPANFVGLVPIYADFDGKLASLGTARITGTRSIDVKLALPSKPKRVMINAMNDVLEQ